MNIEVNYHHIHFYIHNLGVEMQDQVGVTLGIHCTGQLSSPWHQSMFLVHIHIFNTLFVLKYTGNEKENKSLDDISFSFSFFMNLKADKVLRMFI